MRALRVLVVWLALVSPTTARAQDAQGNTFNLQLFRPSMDSKGYFGVNASQVLGHLDFSLGLVGSYARDVMVLQGDGGTSFRVSDFITAQVQAALGLWKRGEVGVSLPVHILFGSRGPTYVSPDSSNQNSDLTFGGQMVGDLGLHGKVRILDSRHPVGLAIAASLYLPTGQSSKFLGEGNLSLRPEVILDKEFGRARRFRMALNAGALVRFTKNTFTDLGTTITDPGVNGGNAFCFPAPTMSLAPMSAGCGTGQSRSLGTQLTYGLGVSGAVVPQKLDLVAELFGYADVTGSANAHPLEWLAGAKVYLASKSYLELGAGTGIIPNQTGSPSVRAFIGFIFEPAIGDRDGDGIKDDVDKCPDEPEDYDGFEDEDGCPDPDNDHDGIPDVDDKCPNEPETYNGFQDDDGCPDVDLRDRDGDGIPDKDDKCPDEPEDFDGFEDQDGCPDPDNDHDGIPDVDDLCPNEPETYNGFEDQDGCPDKGGPVRLRRGHLQLLEKIHFETAKATIKPISFPVLDAVVATLQGNKQIKVIEIQGHADERGDDDYNLQLTEDRAQSVKRYLVDHGVDLLRLRAHGYGETRPLCRKHNEQCWSENRRVEFIIVDQEGSIAGQE